MASSASLQDWAPKLVFRMSRLRGRGSLAIGKHPQEDRETTHRLAWDHGQLSNTGTQG